VGPCALDYALQIQPLHLLAPTRLWPFCPIASGVHKSVRCSSPKITRIYKGLENLGGTPGLAPPVESIQEIPHVSPYTVRLPGLASAAHAIVSSIRRKKLSCAGHCRSLRQCRRPFRHESGRGQNAVLVTQMQNNLGLTTNSTT